MRSILFAGSLLTLIPAANAQLTIPKTAQFMVTGNAQLTLSNLDLIDSGTFSPGTGSLLFTGDSTNTIKGGQPIPFFDLAIAKTATTVQLQTPIAVSNQLSFSSGLLDLNGNDIDLGSTGVLVGEQETSHVTGAKGGTVQFTANLTSPSAANPGNLGLTITSAQNLGATLIKRGHQSQTNPSGSGNSILRYYNITPANNTSLNATLRFNYFNAELNGLNEDDLVLWENTTGQQWSALGFDTRNNNSNYIEKDAVASLGLLTLSSSGNALPVTFVSFTATCKSPTVQLAWETAQEENSHYFLVEKSADGIAWNTIGNIPAAGNSTAALIYSFDDGSPDANDFYRIAEYDLDGKSMYSHTVRSGCSINDALKIWPNPATDLVYISLPANLGSHVTINLFDVRGALIKQQTANPAAATFSTLNVKELAAGVYYISIISANGQIQTQKIMKQ
jgi:hypothetical protein